MTKKKTDEAEAPVQCAAEEDGVRCLFAEHDETIPHAFTEEAASAIEEAAASAQAPEPPAEAPAAPEAAPEAPAKGRKKKADEEPEAPARREAVAPLRESVNSWWCGNPGCDTAMAHVVAVCSKCGTPRA